LYSAQTINLIGDALTWLGLALLAFELVGENAGVILSTALTLRVTAFVVLSPLAGVIADRVDRKRIMVVTHLARMVIVCLLPFVTQPWQIYVIVLSLNVFSAFFTPTYTATIPLVATQSEYPQAIALSSATYQLLGVLGPGLAGSIAAFVGTRQVFWLDGLTFLMAAILVVTLPGQLRVTHSQQDVKTLRRTWQDIRTGTICLFHDPLIRHALLMQLVAAIVGAAILVNTVGYVQGTLQLGKLEYGWVMAAFGIGATLASLGLGSFSPTVNKTVLTSLGAILITVALLPANWVGLGGLFLLWAMAGIGQTLVNVPTQTLIADRVDRDVQGRVYGAQFAWSHFWWAFSYPLAGWLGGQFPAWAFLGSSLIGITFWGGAHTLWSPTSHGAVSNGLWHDHEHRHDEHHQHVHWANVAADAPHRHLHYHRNYSPDHH
ncbi:MFS transporter, partial [Acaryochloris sp. IP29b_bin.148]|uniref:MFS transporter n=1 Tax=Acaryochloris sp. IP29b_bin.148 TaxID=2969218 RepID=UPI00262F3350